MEEHYVFYFLLSMIILIGIISFYKNSRKNDKENNVEKFKSEFKPANTAPKSVPRENVIRESPKTNLSSKKPAQKSNKTYSNPEKQLDEVKDVEDSVIQTRLKIGYEPNELFHSIRNEYPQVEMPPKDSIIKLPQIGKGRRKGFKEKDFKATLDYYFSDKIQILDNQLLMVKNGYYFEPDFCLIILENDVNIFIDIEIDEPYEGINDIEGRKVTHEIGMDFNRDSAFSVRGWITIRISEFQVHLFPKACCRHIAEVIASIHKEFEIPTELQQTSKLEKMSRWTNLEGKKMSLDKYRENYLNINSFGIVPETIQKIKPTETEEGKEIENQIKDELKTIKPFSKKSPQEIFHFAINTKKSVKFNLNENLYFVSPIHIEGDSLKAYCFLRNEIQQFSLKIMSNLKIIDFPFLLEEETQKVGIEKIKSIMNLAIRNSQYVQIHYRRSDFANLVIDTDTGEVVNIGDPEAPIRTISNIQLAINNSNREPLGTWLPDENYITAYCHTRKAERMFKFERIQKIGVLNL